MNAATPAFPWASVSIANGWQNLNARRLFKEVVVRSHGDEPLASATQERGIVARDDLDIQVWNPESDTSNYKRIEPGQFVISLRSFQGGFEISRITGILSPAYTTLHPLRPELNEFYRWFFKSVPFISAVNSVASGIRQGKAIKFEDFASLSLPVPPASEATIIAAYLDRETGRIDALVERLERLIALLIEKRQAVISHAVTKGLNPDAPMKDSGIDWLGDVPAHWELKRIKHLAARISKGTTPSTIGADFTLDGVRFLKAENVSTSGVSVEPEFFISEDTHLELKRSELKEGDLLVVIAGATTGRSGVLPDELTPANTNQAVSFVRCEDVNWAPFVDLWLSQKGAQFEVLSGSVQSAQPNLSMEDLGNLPIACPPVDERDAILKRLSNELSDTDRTIDICRRQVLTIKERRSALISAAVTGQISIAEMTPDITPEDAA